MSTPTERIRARLAELRAQRAAEGRRVQPARPPRYDAVFFEGVAWLDALSHDPPTHNETEHDLPAEPSEP